MLHFLSIQFILLHNSVHGKMVLEIWCRDFRISWCRYRRIHKSFLPRQITFRKVWTFFQLSTNCCTACVGLNTLSQSGTLSAFVFSICLKQNFNVLNVLVHSITNCSKYSGVSRLPAGESFFISSSSWCWLSCITIASRHVYGRFLHSTKYIS